MYLELKTQGFFSPFLPDAFDFFLKPGYLYLLLFLLKYNRHTILCEFRVYGA